MRRGKKGSNGYESKKRMTGKVEIAREERERDDEKCKDENKSQWEK